MKKGWEMKKLGDVCEVKPPKKEAFKKVNDDSVRVSFVPMSDLNVLSKSLTLKQEKKLSEVYKSYTYFAENDVLLAKITPCFENGKLGIARELTNGIGFGSSEYIILRSNGEIDSEFLFYFLSQESFREEGKLRMTGAVGHKRIPPEFVSNYPIPIPSLPEQKRIVKILDKAFAAIDKAKENAEKNLQNSKELFDSYLQGVFANPSASLGTGPGKDWEEKKIKEIGIVKTGTTPTTKDKKNYGNFIPFIKPSDFNKDGTLNLNNFGLSEKGYKKARIIEGNSILMVCIGASIGKTAFTKFEISCNQQINTLTPNKTFESKFFYYHMLINNFQNIVKKNAGQTTLPIINKTKWENLVLSFPKSIPKQKQIVSKLDSLSVETKRLEDIYRKKVADLKELKKSVLQKAFEGEL